MERTKIRIRVIRKDKRELRFCCTLSPEEMRERADEVTRWLPFVETGNGWRVELRDERYAPTPCGEYEGCWHYVAHIGGEAPATILL